MGQKVNPNIFRVSLKKNWTSVWFDNRNYSSILEKDYIIRKIIFKHFSFNLINKVIIGRINFNFFILIYTNKSFNFLKNKENIINNLKNNIFNVINENCFNIFFHTLKDSFLNVNIIAFNIAKRIEKRESYKKVIKENISNISRLKNVYGIKIMISGRLNGAEIARKEWFINGKIPNHTLNANIDYSFCKAKTIYGIIGIKIWLYKIK